MRLAIAAAVIIACFAFIIIYARRAAEHCIFCGGMAYNLKQVSAEKRDAIKKYFDKVQGKVPKDEDIWCCKDCDKIDDDSISSNATRGTCMTCKVCKNKVFLDDSETCPECGIQYRWVKFEECGDHLFFIPFKPEQAADISEGQQLSLADCDLNYDEAPDDA